MASSRKTANSQPVYTFTGNQHGLHTRVGLDVHHIEICEVGDIFVTVSATIGLSRIKFDMTIEQALETDIIEKV